MSHSQDQATYNDAGEIGLKELILFGSKYYKKILLLGISGLALGLVAGVLFGKYTATITMLNNGGIDLPTIKFLQTALPKIEEENQLQQKNEENMFLAYQPLWEKSIKTNLLIKKSDSKDLLDPSTLNSAGSKISTIEFISRCTTKDCALQKVEKIKNFYFLGSTFISVREIVRKYELQTINIENQNQKKIASAMVELDYLQNRIKNLTALKNQYPSTAYQGGQVLDAKDSGAKYLPITTQIVAATTDLNNIQESLARFKDELIKSSIFKAFVEKAKPILEAKRNNPHLAEDLLTLCNELDQSVTNPISRIALEEIKIELSGVITNKEYGLRQIGEIVSTPPAYLMFMSLGLFIGIVCGLIWSFFLNESKK